MRVGPDTRITLHFSVRLLDGTELDSNFDKAPASFVWGDESLLPGFERAIRGLKAGDQRSVLIDAKNGFGEYNDQNVQHFTRDALKKQGELSMGMMISFADAAGSEVPGVVTSFDDEWVTVDFNHPLAGRDLTFEVNIIKVEPYAPEQVVKFS